MSSSKAGIRKSKRKRVTSETLSTRLGYGDECDAGDVFNSEQQELLDLIEKEDVNEVREFFARASAFDVNRGQIGRTALRLAIYNERADIAEILLQNGVRIGSALFSAVIEGARDCVQLFLDSRYVKSGDIGPSDHREGLFMSPLMLAVRLEDHDIIKYMVSKGFEIEDPENCAHGNESSESQEEVQFLFHINSYRALANPLYMAYSFLHDPESEHPIFSAFNLLETLDCKATVHHEFKRDYKELAQGCEEFAVSLLEQCRTMEEIKILTDIRPDIVSLKYYNEESKYIEVHADTEEAKELTFLNMALRIRCDKLVAHPYSQLRLNNVLHTEIPKVTCCELMWRNKSFLSKVIYSVRHTLLFPFLAIIYLLVPNLPLSMSLTKPLVKFVSHTGSFVVFLVLLIISAFQDQFHTRIDTPSLVEWMIFVWVVGLAIQELKAFYNQGFKMYRRQWWNIVSLLMVIFFVLSYIFQIIAYVSVGSWAVLDRLRRFIPTSGYQAILVANSLFTVGMVLSFLHISNAFQVNAIFGPMQLSLYKLLKDVLKFLVFFGLLFVAFGLSLRKLYSHYVSTRYHLAKANTANRSYAGAEHHFERVGKSMESLFWSLFGLTDLDAFEIDKPEFQITRDTGVALFGLYQVLIVVVAINMLIAMMTRSFEIIVQAEDLHWKVSRTRMWMNWVNKGSVLPSPYNLIPNPKVIVHWFRSIRNKYRAFQQNTATPATRYEVTNNSKGRNIGELPREVHGIEMVKIKWSVISKRRRILKQIVERYVHMRKEDSRREDSENLKDIKAIQELMWHELGRRVEGFPRSPLTLTPTPAKMPKASVKVYRHIEREATANLYCFICSGWTIERSGISESQSTIVTHFYSTHAETQKGRHLLEIYPELISRAQPRSAVYCASCTTKYP